jgi:hypothetical protein
VIAAHAPGLSESRRITAARLVVQTVSAALFLILRDPDDRRSRELIAELKIMLRTYAAALVA